MDTSTQPPDRLSDEEIHFVRPGESSEIKAWNRAYGLLMAEYQTALDQQDEGWASERVAEIRKCLGGFKRADASLVEAAGQEFQDQQATFWIA